MVPNRGVASVVNAITSCQGAFITGPADAAFLAASVGIAKMLGQKYDVFLSYRVAADGKDAAHRHVERLYNQLVARGLHVYWDIMALKPGVDWEQGFCEGLVSSKTFVPLLSRGAINHPEKDWQNFSKLTAASKIDNVYLEHRFALELQSLKVIEKVFPVFIGDVDPVTGLYSNYFGSGCHPALPQTTVDSVDAKLAHFMVAEGLGAPKEPQKTVFSVVNTITACQGAFIQGDGDAAFAAAADAVYRMVHDGDPNEPVAKVVDGHGGGGGGGGGSEWGSPSRQPHKALLEAKEAELAALRLDVEAAVRGLGEAATPQARKAALAALKASLHPR